MICGLEFAPHWKASQIAARRQQERKGQLCPSEIMTLLIHFHQSHYRSFKAYYTEHVQQHLTSEFPRLVSSQRLWLSLLPRKSPYWLPRTSRYGPCTGISFID